MRGPGNSACAGGIKMVKIAFTIPPAWVPAPGSIRMVHGRIEMSSAEQLVELRKARDRYKALADRFREEGDALAQRFESEGDPLAVMQEKLAHERDARRIANAYEKSIANIVASGEAMRQAHASARGARSIGARLIVLLVFLIASGAILLAVAYPGLYRQALDYVPDGSRIRDYFVPMRPMVKLDSGVAPSAPAPQRPAATMEERGAIAPRPAPVVTPVPVKKRPARETQKTARPPEPSVHEGDFSVKVLQPDGTLKEQVFSAKPRRR